MNNGTTEVSAIPATPALKAEVRLAKARATVVNAEIDIKVLSARLKAAPR